MFEPSPKTSLTNFSLYPLAWLAVSFAIGILIGKYFTFSLQFYLVICLVMASAAIVFFKRKFATHFLISSFIALGAFCFQAEKQSIAANRLKTLYDKNELLSGEPVKIDGILQGKPELAVGGFFLELKAEKLTYKETERNVSGKVRLFAPVLNEQVSREYELLQLNYGTEIRVGCELRREDKFSNPGVVRTKDILDQKDLDATAIIKSPLLVENLGARKTFMPLAWAYERRQELILDFKKYFSVSTAGVLIASLLGNRYHLNKESAEKFREGGTFHVVVISGLQITFIGGLAILLIRRFTKNRWAQFLSASTFLWLYTLTVGVDVPVTRAAIMFTILHFGNVIFRQSTLLNALGASALILLIWRPSDFFDQSFQLTFACVTAIVAMAFPLLEKIRAIGEWRPNAETPVPPNCSKKLKNFCEALYWSETGWQREQSRSVWQANLFKTERAAKLEQRKLQKPLRYIFEMVMVSAIVQAWLVPFLVVYFHRISLIAIFLNIWVGILMAIESLAAIFAILLAQVSEILALPLLKLTEILNWLLLHFADWFIDNGWASVRLPHYSGSLKIVYVLYFLPIIAITFYLHNWKPFRLTENGKLKTENDKKSELSFFKSQKLLSFSLFSFVVLLSLIIFHPFSAPKPDGRLHVDFLNVGQGDSALITMPTGETLLVDGGGKPNFNSLYVKREDEEPELFVPDTQNIGEAVVSTFLWEKGYDKVDYILATHADADHIQGLAEVAENFKTESAILGRTPLKNPNFAELYDALQKRHVPIMNVSRGEVLNFGDAKIEILYPNYDANTDAVSDNNHSIVLRLVYGERKILLTGDIEKETEAELLDAPEFLQTEVVKVAHHGSKTSSTGSFINAVGAKLAVISVGKESPFGHPKPEVVERWKLSGAKVVTTGENGTISISTDGKGLQLKTFNGKIIYR